MNKSRGGMDKKGLQLPTWLWASSNSLPSVYRCIWDAVREEEPSTSTGELLVDTKKIFPLLLTSQLPTEVLGYIWGLANQKYAGKLTEQELYVVLALVAIAQTSYPFTNLDVLHLMPGPLNPRLNLALIYPNVAHVISPLEVEQSFQECLQQPSYAESICKTASASVPSALSGFFSDQCNAEDRRANSNQTSNLTKNSTKSCLEPKQTALLQEDSKDLPSSVLSMEESDEFSEFQSAPIPQAQGSGVVCDSRHGLAIGSRLANHNLGVKKTGEKTRKTGGNGNGHKNYCGAQPKASLAGSPAIGIIDDAKGLFASAECLGELFPKCSLKTSPKMVILKDTVIRNNDLPKSETTQLSRRLPRGTSNSINVSSKENHSSVQDLMNLQQVEDKYSALRILVEDQSASKPVVEVKESLENASQNQTDDFGDFVSAEQPLTTDAPPVELPAFPELNTEPFWNMDSATHAFGNLEIRPTIDRESLDERYDVTVELEKTVQREDAVSVNSIELGNCSLDVITRSNSVPSLDLKSFLSSGVEEEQQQMDSMHQLIYWEWKQYMDSCVLLLQTAAKVFSGITTDAVLQEVLASAQGYNFLCDLAEVAAVCRRVNFSHKEMEINIMGFDDLLMNIDRIWAEMEPFYSSIPIVTELPVWPLHQNEAAASCALCLTVVTSGRIVYNDNNYHVTCANLWLNCVNSNLPALRYPLSLVSFQHSIPVSSVVSGSQI